MTEEQNKQLERARQAYTIARKDRDSRYYRVAYDEYKPLFESEVLDDFGDLNSFLSCCKWINAEDSKKYFVKVLHDVESGKVKTKRKDDINHARRNYINHLIDNLKDYLTAEELINEIKSQFDNDFQLFDLEAKLYSKTNRIQRAAEMFDEKLSDWNLHKRQKNRNRREWFWFHRNFYALFFHFINDTYLNKTVSTDFIKSNLGELKLAINKISQILRSEPSVKNSKGSFVVGNAENLLIALDEADENVIEREKVFISYARPDKNKWLQMIKKFLKPLERDGLMLWADEEIKAGADAKKDIEYQLRSVKVGLLVVTQSFLNSDFIDKYELPQLKNASKNGMILIPIICEHCSYLIDDRLKHLNSRPDPKDPLESLSKSDQNKTMSELLFEIKKYLDEEKEADSV